MLNSGANFRALRDKQKIRTLVLFEKKLLKENKNQTPPFQVKLLVPNDDAYIGKVCGGQS